MTFWVKQPSNQIETIHVGGIAGSDGTCAVKETAPVDFMKKKSYEVLTSTNSPYVNGTISLRANELMQNKTLRAGVFPIWGRNSHTVCPFEAAPTWAVDCNHIMNGHEHAIDSWEVAEDALRGWYSQVNQIEMKLAEYAVEYRRTANSIGGKMDDLRHLLLSIKRKNTSAGLIRPQGSISDTIANEWLASQFMWLPILKDIENLCNGFDPKVDGFMHSFTASKEGRAEKAYTYPTGLMAGPIFNIERTTTQCVNATASAKIIPKSLAASYMRSTGLTDLSVIAWDSLPFSFVIDWLYPVGAWLQNLGAGQTVSITDASVTIKDTRRSVNTFSMEPPQSVKGSGKLFAMDTAKQRTLGFPGVPPPKVNVDLDVWHVITSWALLRKVFGR